MLVLLHLFFHSCLAKNITFTTQSFGQNKIYNLQQLPEKGQKIIIKLEQKFFDYTQLLLCEIYENEGQNNCSYDVNSYDLKKNVQILQLIYEDNVENYKENFYSYRKIKSINETIVVKSRIESNYTISMSSTEIFSCSQECQNLGTCKNGMCLCQIGYFGADCSIQAFNVRAQKQFEAQNFYYLNLEEIGYQNYTNLKLQKISQYKQFCLADEQFFLQSQTISSDEINILNIEYCLQKVQEQNMLASQFSFILFYFEISVEINNSNYNQETKTILIIVLSSVSSSFFICFSILCYYLVCRKRKEEHQIVPTINFYSKGSIQKYLPKIQFKNILKQYPGLASIDECLICLDKIAVSDFVRMTYCTHIFHYNCIDNWLEKNKVCPACRSDLDDITLKKITTNKKDSLILNTQKANRLFGELGALSQVVSSPIRSGEITHRS